jgi:hypothetical protein
VKVPEKFLPQYTLRGYMKRLFRPYRWTTAILLALCLGLGFAHLQAKQRQKADAEWEYGTSPETSSTVPYLCNNGRVIKDCPHT